MITQAIRRIAEKIVLAKSAMWSQYLDATDARDAIENSGRGNVAQSRQYRLRDPRAHILRRLGHVAVNPQDILNTNMLTRSYVYVDSGKEETARGEIIVNAHADVAKAFVERLVDLAIDARTLSEEANIIDPTGEISSTERCMLLFGEKGCGKTYFLNYLLSRYHDYFDKQKCVWVRLNLVDDRSFDDHIYSWVYAQITKILFRYYDETSIRYTRRDGIVSDFSKHLAAWIARQDASPALKLRWEESLAQMKQVFCQDHERGISAEYCIPILCEEVFDYAKKSGLAFVVVLDGFDRLEGNEDEPDRFEKIKRGVIELLSEYERFGCVFVVTTRVLTFASVQTVNPFSTINVNNRYFVEAAPITNIFESRIEAIKKEIIGLQNDFPIWTGENWIDRLSEFAIEMLSLANESESMTNLETALSHNNRAKTQIIRLRFQEFLQRKTGQGYQLLEHMTRGGMRYPPVIFNYARNGGKVTASISTATSFDNYFLPIITRPPILQPSSGGPDANWLQLGSILHGTRILQMIDAHDSLLRGREGATYDRITIGELANVLNQLFGYEEEQTALFCRELERYEVIRFTERALAHHRSNVTMMRGYPKLGFILTRCIGQLAYLNLCAMRSPVAQKCFLPPELFRPAFIDYDDINSLPRWVVNKVANSVSLLGAMVFINDFHKRQFEERSGSKIVEGRMRTTVDRSVKLGLFRFVDELVPKVMGEIEAVVRSTGSIITLNADRIQITLEGLAEKLDVKLTQ